MRSLCLLLQPHTGACKLWLLVCMRCKEGRLALHNARRGRCRVRWWKAGGDDLGEG